MKNRGTLIAAPRERSVGRSFQGQVFLHDYDWRRDEGFGVLELILTAPVIVASWISLQYYGSVVAPSLFGGGNGGTLRGGLPWQSVHDGKTFMHDPLRLTVCVEAPSERIDEILAKHDHARALLTITCCICCVWMRRGTCRAAWPRAIGRFFQRSGRSLGMTDQFMAQSRKSPIARCLGGRESSSSPSRRPTPVSFLPVSGRMHGDQIELGLR